MESVDLSNVYIRGSLDAIRPNEWFNIPAPVVDAVTVLMHKMRENMDRIMIVQSDLKMTQKRMTAKEKRQNESLKEVLDYCREEISQQSDTLVQNI